METIKTMTCKNLLVLLVGVFALALFASGASAFADITNVEVNGINALGGIDLSNLAGDTIAVKVTFKGDFGPEEANLDVIEDVKVKTWLTGESENVAVSSRFDVLDGKTYQRTVYLTMPFDLDEHDESRDLEIIVENTIQGRGDSKTISLTIQREAYLIEILSVNMQPEVKAGEAFTVDVVLKNRGSHEAVDTYLKVSFPELGLETITYYEDLASKDYYPDGHDTQKDSASKRTFLRLPADTPAGFYTVVFEAYDDDSLTRVEKKVLVNDAGEDTIVITSDHSKTFKVGETKEYGFTIVNSGSTVRVYEVILGTSSTNLDTDLTQALVVVSAGSSKDLSILAEAGEKGDYVFTAEVYSDGELVDTVTFSAEVEGGSVIGTGTNSTVVLTVILAIVFVVLLIVLIVLLTRKPAKAEEFGESYY